MSDFDQIPAVPANTPVVEENVIITEQAKDTTLTDQNVTQVQTLSTEDVIAAEVPVLKKKEVVIALDSFSWAEEPNYVKIYVDFEHANNLTDEQIHFSYTIDSLELKVEQDDNVYMFDIDALFDRIESATLKKKKDKFIITLKKLKERIWYKIRF